MLCVDFALAQRLERNEAAGIADYPRLLKQLRPDSDASLEEIAGGCAVFTGRAFPINRAVGLGMQEAITTADMERVEHFYRRVGMPAEVELCPLADPSLIEQLGARGYRVLRFYNIYARSLQLSEERRIAPAPEVVVTESRDASLWLRASTGREDRRADDLSSMLATITFHRPGARCFLGWVGGEAVGTAALLLREGLATLFSASTHPAFRRRGVQQALLEVRLTAACEADCDLAMVMTVPGTASQRNVQRAGFELAYTKVVLQHDL